MLYTHISFTNIRFRILKIHTRIFMKLWSPSRTYKTVLMYVLSIRHTSRTSKLVAMHARKKANLLKRHKSIWLFIESRRRDGLIIPMAMLAKKIYVHMYSLNISAHVNSSVRRTSALWTSRWLSATICYQVRHLTVGLTANHLSNNYQRTNDRGGITGGSGHFTRLRQLSWLPPMRWWGHTSSEVILPPMRAFHQWVWTAELCTISIDWALLWTLKTCQRLCDPYAYGCQIILGSRFPFILSIMR